MSDGLREEILRDIWLESRRLQEARQTQEVAAA